MAITDGVIDTADFPAAQQGGFSVPEPAKPKALQKLLGYIEADNLADELDDEELGRLGHRVIAEYELDYASNKEFFDTYKRAMDLALQVAKEKNFPWPKAANIKYPLLTVAAIQFASRAYPAIVQGRDVVKGKVTGRDPTGEKRDRADRVARHMSWQLLDDMEDWEEDTDRLLHAIPIAGCVFRKTYYDPGERRNVSEMITADRLVVDKWTKSMERARRATQESELYPHEVEERRRDGRFLDVELGINEQGGEDEDAPFVFLEQHRWWDMDEDGYPEPYIVTVHKDTRKVVRVRARFDKDGIDIRGGEVVRIKPVCYFTKYGFLPNPDGSFYDVGFGTLLEPVNAAINTVINQMLDAGTLQNAGGGFIGTNMRLKTGNYRFAPGEWKKIDLQGGVPIGQSVFPIPAPGPSAVLFSLLGTLIEAGREIGSVKDVLQGDQERNQPATTTLALIEQGMKVYSALYKRIHRSLKKELGKLYRLNRLYMDDEQYFTVLDTPEAIGKVDYEDKSFDVEPISDPTMVTDMQRLARAEFMMQFREDPTIDTAKLNERIWEFAGIEDIEELKLDKPREDPAAVAAQAQAAEGAAKLELEKIKAQEEMKLTEAKRVGEYAKAIKAIAEAEAVESGPQMELYKANIQELKTILDTQIQRERNVAPSGDGAGAVPGVDGAAGNPGVLDVSVSPTPVVDGSVGTGPAAPGTGAGPGAGTV